MAYPKYGPVPGLVPPTRQISFQQQVMSSDPAWQQERQRPRIYDFSNGRVFVGIPNIYTYAGP